MKQYFLAILFFFYAATAIAATNPDPQIQKLGQDWAMALSSGDPQKIVALYDNNAILYATFTDQINSRQGLVDYFTKLMQNKNLKVEFNNQNIRRYSDTAINSGLYTFSFDSNGKTVKVPARYSFVYSLVPNKGWLIVDHHSSKLPQN